MKKLAAVAVFVLAVQASAQPVPGSTDVHWNEGAEDCEATPPPPLQVHAYEPQTYILRQNPCADPEANFIYLLIGEGKALLIDTGASADPTRMPLARVVSDLLPIANGSRLPLVIVHTHDHLDHHAGDPQFESWDAVEIAPVGLQNVQAFFDFNSWPEDVAQIDLGGRTIEVVPTPGHEATHLVFYDERTGVLFSGDFLLPGRLLISDLAAYRASAERLIHFLQPRPVTHILGGHIELDIAGDPYPSGSTYHPNERPLELSRNDLLTLPIALNQFNGFYSRQPNYVLSNPLHNLAALLAALALLIILLAWGLRRLLRKRRL